MWWDNPKTVVPFLFKGRQRVLNERYAALASHYRFEPLFCRVRQPQEKPRVEGRVRFLQRDWSTPVPEVRDLDELNTYLRTCAWKDRGRTQSGQADTIGQRFSLDSDKALSLPERPFDPCIRQPAQVDKYQTARFDRNAYSVPRAFAFQAVTIKGYINCVEIVAGDQVVARHVRSYGHGEQILDPLHYLATLGRRPAALDHANVYRHWQLPPVFTELRGDLERQHGAQAGRGSSFASCNCWPSIRSNRSNVPSRPARAAPATASKPSWNASATAASAPQTHQRMSIYLAYRPPCAACRCRCPTCVSSIPCYPEKR